MDAMNKELKAENESLRGYSRGVVPKGDYMDLLAERDALKAKIEGYFGMLELVHQVLSEEADGDIIAEFLLPKISAALAENGE